MTFPLCCRANDRSHRLLLATAGFCAFVPVALAHVEIEAPNGGEMLTGGSTFTIAWRPAVAMHDTLGFDVAYSTVANDGPWTDIAVDVPPGNLTVGSFHSFDWTVPNISDPSAWVRVRQVNDQNPDYEDVSETAFSIVAAGLAGDYNNDGTVDAGDYVRWRNHFGEADETNINGAGDGGGVGPGDYTWWKERYGNPGGGGLAQSRVSTVPEPASLAQVLLAAVLSLCRRPTTWRGRTCAASFTPRSPCCWP